LGLGDGTLRRWAANSKFAVPTWDRYSSKAMPGVPDAGVAPIHYETAS